MGSVGHVGRSGPSHVGLHADCACPGRPVGAAGVVAFGAAVFGAVAVGAAAVGAAAFGADEVSAWEAQLGLGNAPQPINVLASQGFPPGEHCPGRLFFGSPLGR